MEFNDLKCPACNTPLESDDDIVVCPVCGAPHHRECYEETGHCYFESKHKENFDYDEYIKKKQAEKQSAQSFSDSNAQSSVKCQKCGTFNPGSAFYCNKCGAPLNFQQTSASNQNQGGMPPFGMPLNFDPMAGMNPNEEIDDGVTAGETAKYIQTNTPYFLRIFANIRDNNKSRFNISAFLFTGGYMLYRKMYKLGAIFTIIVGGLILAALLIQTLPVFGWYEILENASKSIETNSILEASSQIVDNISLLPIDKQTIFYLPLILSSLRFPFMIIAGCITNKAYFKDCIKKIKKIKDETNGNEQEINIKIKEKGGINFKIAVVVFICYMLINYIPYFFI